MAPADEERPRPRVLVSRCLGFDACRYNGMTIESAEVTALRQHVEYVDVCPEVAIGLGVPRDPVRVVRERGVDRLVQPATGRDLTTEMAAFAEERLASVGPLDGAVLKSRSPSCGVKDTKAYPSAGPSAPFGRTAGFFAREVGRRFPDMLAEDEGRLTNFRIRERFLTAIFTLAAFRALRERVCDDAGCARSETAREVMGFHSANKLLLMAQNQAEMRRLGGIAANHEGLPAAEVLDAYGAALARRVHEPAAPHERDERPRARDGLLQGAALLGREGAVPRDGRRVPRGQAAAERARRRRARVGRALRRAVSGGADVLRAVPAGADDDPRLGLGR